MTQSLYPLFLNLHDACCLVAGFGEVGRRKVSGLLQAGAGCVRVRDLALPQDDDGRQMLARPQVAFLARACTAEDIADCRLVFAATSDAGENARIAALCREQQVLCNCVDAPLQGDFMIPAVARKGELALALSTGGASPALARRWRRELEEWLEPRESLSLLMGRLRAPILALGHDSRQNRELFRTLAESPLQHWLQEGNREACREFLIRKLPPELHTRITEFLHDLS